MSCSSFRLQLVRKKKKKDKRRGKRKEKGLKHNDWSSHHHVHLIVIFSSVIWKYLQITTFVFLLLCLSHLLTRQQLKKIYLPSVFTFELFEIDRKARAKRLHGCRRAASASWSSSFFSLSLSTGMLFIWSFNFSCNSKGRRLADWLTRHHLP